MMISHSRPWIREEDIAAVTAVMRSGQLAGGEQVHRFETELARVVGQSDGVATSSGTAALHLALVALGVTDGDDVLLPSYACTAVLNAVHHARARPLLCDVDPETGNLDPADARRRLTKQTKAAIVVHLFGHPADMGWIGDVGIPVVEDCAQALGARWHGRPVGGIGAISVFSFYATKVISTGEGGMACASSPELLARMRSLRDYDNQTEYEVRYNYKMSDIQASLGLAQLARLPAALERRRKLAGLYSVALSGTELEAPRERDGCESIFYRYVVQTSHADRLIAGLRASGIECKRPVFRPLHHYLNGGAPDLVNTDAIYRRAVSLPLYPALRDEEATRVTEALCEVAPGTRIAVSGSRHAVT